MDDNYCTPLAAILRKAQGCIYRGTDEFIDVGGEVSELRRICDSQRATISRLEAELEIERMRLVACSVVSLANTPESAAQARDMHPDYRSFACDDVARMVDREMEHRTTISRLREYAKHKRECWSFVRGGHDCDCGYDDLIKEIGDDT